ncbi:unnamed protein product [Euphydryas editha]|uniref:Uncharacterized protein n=1 Tax=Euphydryas editha TaxID=104508 RepID=A0AAU9TCL2_EUPED|nr:unnamed protein product [Euphydryas editha]
MYLSLFTAIVCASGALSSILTAPCKINDLNCLENGIKSAIPQFLSGISDLGIEPSDPQFLEIIEGNFSGMKYTLYNTTIFGYDKCKLSNLKLSEDFKKVHSEANCSFLSMSGEYEISGQLISIPIEGKGHFNVDSAEFIITVDYKTKKYQNSDGKSHLYIEDFNVKAQPLNAKYNFQNLFNGQKELADTVHKFIRENWLKITELFQYPVWNTSFKKMVNNMNMFLKNVALEDISSN